MFQQRAHVYEQNKMLCTVGILKDIPVHKSKKYSGNLSFNNASPASTPVVSVVPYDCLDVAKYFTSNGYKPVVLNMADINFPGSHKNL